MRITDVHAHLDEPALQYFVSNFTPGLSVISNSVDLESSARNIELAKNSDSIIPFVGIHPDVFRRSSKIHFSREILDIMVEQLRELFKSAKGIGEIGLDPSYGHIEEQEYLLGGILSAAETTNLPITFHCRETIPRIQELVESFDLHSRILFHWFAGSDSDLKKLHEKGVYTSFGPSILFSKRIGALVQHSTPDLILAETDSPTTFRSIFDAPSTPMLVGSVVFKVGLILGKSFVDTCEMLESNASKYLSTQH